MNYTFPRLGVIEEFRRVLDDMEHAFWNELFHKTMIAEKELEAGNYITLEQLEKELE